MVRTPFASPSEALSLDTLRLSALHRRTTIPKLPLTSGASSGSGQYYVDLSLGSPPQRLRLVADTGSDLLWVTCSACNNCTHRRPASAFFARRSSSFSLHHCFDSACQLVPHPSRVRCNRTRLHSSCRYEYSYADGSTTGGFFSTETITFNTSAGGEVRHEGLAFGCAFSISGPSLSGPNFNGAQGVMALGRGPISLSSQLGRRFANKFSYCLKDYTLSPSPTSYLMIGGERNDVVARKSAMSYTSLQNNPLSPTFYYIGVQSVSVAGLKLRISPSVWAIDDMGSGGTVVDSGTTLTFLADPAYRKVLAAFNRFVKLPKLAEPIQGFDLCVNVSGDSKPSLPGLSFTLAGGSVFNPPPRNYFVDAADDVKCLALRPVSSASGFSVIGNLMQQGFLLEFDNGRSRLGFSRHGCAIP
ncbi:Aspartic endopeptidase [Sarracenia purpurea var. burkii]